MTYRLAASLVRFRSEANLKWPGRDKSSDGWIGDPAHATRDSDHNPWVKDNRGVGVVRAFDLDGGPGMSDPIGSWAAEYVRGLGKRGFKPLGNGSYVISNRRIADASSGWNWVRYNGVNPHTHHTHISVGLAQSSYDSTVSWGLANAPAPSAPAPSPAASSVLQMGSKGAAVVELQKVLNRWYPSLPKLATDGDFGPATRDRVKYFQTRAGLVSDGVVGPQTKAVLHI